MPTIAFSGFVRRQTKWSPHSYTDLPDEEVLRRVQAHFAEALPGYRPDVLKVPVEPDGFYSSTVTLKYGDSLRGQYTPRADGEMCRKGVQVVGGDKTPAKYVEIILYSHAALQEDGGASTDADWEIISINASACAGPEPIPMEALLYNYFHEDSSGDGGTAMPGTTPEQFVALLRESFMFWRDRARAAGPLPPPEPPTT